MTKNLAVAAALLVACFAWAQSDTQAQSDLRGVVTTEDGRGIAGVNVYGSMSKTCCPFKRETTSTDGDGQFQLRNPGDVVHFVTDGFEPALVFIKPNVHDIRVTLKPSTRTLALPTCSKPGSNRRVGWGEQGLMFDVPRNLRLKGGIPDVDYVRYVVRRNGSAGFVELWFGPYTLSADPDDDLLMQSVMLSQRTIESSIGMAGVDSWGKLRDGTNWRWMAVVGEGGSVYRNVSDDDAKVFDAIVNSLCEIPRRR